jgi:hypothetical protein
MMVRVTMLAAAMLVAASVQASSAPKKVIGTGAYSCGTWTQERRSGTGSDALMGNWVVGYVSGANVYDSGPDFLLQTDPNGIVAWVDNYCTSRPLENVFNGAHVLVQELRSRAGRK